MTLDNHWIDKSLDKSIMISPYRIGSSIPLKAAYFHQKKFLK